jgi:hypothetical protein
LRSPLSARSLTAPGDTDTTGGAGAKVSFEYEIVVIGCGRAGEKATKNGARFGKRLAVVEREGRPVASRSA